MRARGPWSATIEIPRRTSAEARRLVAALSPEADREVPRARSSIRRVRATEVVITIVARDTGAVRAALNTYLGWLKLILTTEEMVAVRVERA